MSQLGGRSVEGRSRDSLSREIIRRTGNVRVGAKPADVNAVSGRLVRRPKRERLSGEVV